MKKPKTKYKKRYVLGVGHLWPNSGTGVSLVSSIDKKEPVELTYPTWWVYDPEEKEPKYRLVLERVK